MYSDYRYCICYRAVSQRSHTTPSSANTFTAPGNSQRATNHPPLHPRNHPNPTTQPTNHITNHLQIHQTMWPPHSSTQAWPLVRVVWMTLRGQRKRSMASQEEEVKVKRGTQGCITVLSRCLTIHLVSLYRNLFLIKRQIMARRKKKHGLVYLRR